MWKCYLNTRQIHHGPADIVLTIPYTYIVNVYYAQINNNNKKKR